MHALIRCIFKKSQHVESLFSSLSAFVFGFGLVVVVFYFISYTSIFFCCYCCWCPFSHLLINWTEQRAKTILNQNLIFRIQWIDKLITEVSYLLDYYQHMNESHYNIPRTLTCKMQFKHKTFKAFSTLPTELGFPIHRTTQTRNVEMKSS